MGYIPIYTEIEEREKIKRQQKMLIKTLEETGQRNLVVWRFFGYLKSDAEALKTVLKAFTVQCHTKKLLVVL